MPSGETPISELNLFLFTPASRELFVPRRKELALEYITRLGGSELASAFLFATGIHSPFSSSTLLYTKVYPVMPEIWELKNRLNYCQYLFECPEPVRTYDHLLAQENLMQSRRADLLRLHGEHIAIIEEPFFIDVIHGCVRQYTPEDRAKLLATFQSYNRQQRKLGRRHVDPAPRVIGVLFFSDSTPARRRPS